MPAPTLFAYPNARKPFCHQNVLLAIDRPLTMLAPVRREKQMTKTKIPPKRRVKRPDP